jgi:hypothetical protein
MPAQDRPPDNPMLTLVREAMATGNIELVKMFVTIYREERSEAARTAYHRAFAKAKAEFLPIVKTRKASFGPGKASYTYEELDNVVDAVVGALSKFGLAHSWRTVNPPEGPISVTCVLAHEDGYSEENTLIGAPDSSGSKNAIQAVISTVTYLQRATLKAKCGLAAGLDDDAHGATSGNRIDADRLLKLENEIERVGADAARVCAYYRIEKLEDLPAKAFDDAMKQCLQFEKQAKQQARA